MRGIEINLGTRAVIGTERKESLSTDWASVRCLCFGEMNSIHC